MTGKNCCKPTRGSSAHLVPRSERGQMLYLVVMMMTAMIGVTAFVVDLGRVFITYHMLQASTDAAALAGAEGLPSASTATSQANTYSSTATSDLNAYSNLSGVSMVSGSPTPECLTTLQNEGIACNTGLGVYNAIKTEPNRCPAHDLRRDFRHHRCYHDGDFDGRCQGRNQ